jgi:hypothetical protein
MGVFKNTTLKYLKYLFYIYLSITILKRGAIFITACFSNVGAVDDYTEISAEICKQMPIVRRFPEICKESNEKITVPSIVRAFGEVIDNTYSCIDMPCTTLLYMLLNNWFGYVILVILGFSIPTVLIALAQGLVNNTTQRLSSKNNYRQELTGVPVNFITQDGYYPNHTPYLTQRVVSVNETNDM